MQKLIEFTAKHWNEHALIIVYKRSSLKILFKDLTESNQQLLRDYPSSEYNLSGFGYLEKFNIDPDSLVLKFNRYGIPILLHKHQRTITEYTKYHYYDWSINRTIEIQKNGFLVYCAPTGGGKTHFAINNLPPLSRQFDTILYINFELSIDDIYNRCVTMDIDIPKNLYISPLDNVDVIREWAEDKGSCMFIIDNIDNLVGGGNDPFGAQLDFIKNLDRYLKDYNHHALVLTQLVKDNNNTILNKDGGIADNITTNSLSGVKQLSYLSRSVMLTAFSPDKDRYVYKVLKVGSAKYE